MKTDDFFSEKNNRRTTRIVNGVWALRVGFGFIVVTLIIVYWVAYWLNGVLFNGVDFRRQDLIFAIWGMTLCAGATYILIRIGYEELKKGSNKGSKSDGK